LVRIGKYTPSRGGPTYLPRDNVRLKVIMYLFAVKKSNQNRMMNDDKASLRGQKWVSLANVLDEMCEWSWIEKKASEDAANVYVYYLLERGKNLAGKLVELEKQDNELRKLDCFHDVKLLD
jgi:DNA-binding HxlR family transcriptional regulator